MKEILIKRLAALFEVKSLVTLALTGALVAMIFNADKISPEMLSLFSTSFGAVITYFFTRKSSSDNGNNKED